MSRHGSGGQTVRLSPSQILWRKLRQNRLALGGGLVILGWALLGLITPLVVPSSPDEANFNEIALPPSLKHPLGTDELGRDVLIRTIYGSRTSFLIGFLAVSLAGAIGTAVGFLSGYFGGLLDHGVSAVTDILLSLPGVLLAIALIAGIGPGTLNVTIAVGLSTLPQFVRVARGSVLSVKEELYVEAARATGERDRSIIFRHILPNGVAPIIVQSSYRVATAILAVAILSFLGLGVQPPEAEWGVMINRGRDFLAIAPHISVVPGMALASAILAFNFLGDGLRDALDPRTYVKE